MTTIERLTCERRNVKLIIPLTLRLGRVIDAQGQDTFSNLTGPLAEEIIHRVNNYDLILKANIQLCTDKATLQVEKAALEVRVLEMRGQFTNLANAAAVVSSGQPKLDWLRTELEASKKFLTTPTI